MNSHENLPSLFPSFEEAKVLCAPDKGTVFSPELQEIQARGGGIFDLNKFMDMLKIPCDCRTEVREGLRELIKEQAIENDGVARLP